VAVATSPPTAPITPTRRTSTGRTGQSTPSDFATSPWFCQDWGGLIGLRPGRGRSEAVCSGGRRPTLFLANRRRFIPANLFLAWQRYSQETPTTQGGGKSSTAGWPQQRCSSDRPRKPTTRHFPTTASKAGARQFPDAGAHPRPEIRPAPANRAGLGSGLPEYDRPFLCAFSDSDPIHAAELTQSLRRTYRVLGTTTPVHDRGTGWSFFTRKTRAKILRARRRRFSLAATGPSVRHLNFAPQRDESDISTRQMPSGRADARHKPAAQRAAAQKPGPVCLRFREPTGWSDVVERRGSEKRRGGLA